MLGLKEVKKICLSCTLIDGLLNDNPSADVKNEMRLAFYSATQARLLSIMRGDPHSEEVFLSALMLNIGPLAMWRVAQEEMLLVREHVEREKCSLEAGEEHVFGFTLAELSIALTKEWNLEQFIPISENPSENEKKRCDEITLATALARSLQFGWESDIVQKIISAIENTISCSLEAIIAVLRDADHELNEMSSSFGIEPAFEPLNIVPPTEDQEKEVKAVVEASTVSATKKNEPDITPEDFVPIQASLEFQMEALRNLSTFIASGAEPTVYIMQAMNGMHKGVGLDRVLFAMLNDSRTILSARLALGPQKNILREQFMFDIPLVRKSIFSHVFTSNDSFWFSKNFAKIESEGVPEAISARVDATDFFLSPVLVSGKWIGMFYADMRASERELTNDLFESFKQFATQANLGFQHFEFSKQLQASATLKDQD